MKEQDFEPLTLFPADSPANPSPWLESKKVKQMIVTSGLKCSELSPNLRRVGLSLRTYLESCELPLMTFARIWSASATTSGYSILKLRLSERRIDESESHLWRTPSVQEPGIDPNRLVCSDGTSPRMGERLYDKDTGRLAQYGLTQQAKMWPTPKTPTGGGQVARNTPGGGIRKLEDAVSAEVGYNTGALNPTWVEWLMGFPIGWTDLNASETP